MVAAANATGSAATAAQTATLALAAPSGTTAAVTGNAPLTVSVGWVDNSVSETGYTVQRATNARPSRPGHVHGGRRLEQLCRRHRLAGRTYYYRVQTVKGAADYCRPGRRRRP